MALHPSRLPQADLPSPGVEYRPDFQGRLISACCPAEGIDIYTFLRHGEQQPRFYWRDGSQGIQFAGVGVALSLMGWGEGRFRQIQRQARTLFTQALAMDEGPSLAAPRLFGGFAFRQDFVPDFTWAAFHPAHFILPHYQLVTCRGESWLTINALLAPGESARARRQALQEALAARYRLLRSLPKVTPALPSTPQAEVDYPLGYSAWVAMIEEALRHFATGRMDKVVLARICQVRSPTHLDIDAALFHLDQRYPGCYTFLVEPRPHQAFFGAPPELLVAVQGSRLQTMGLAGSAPRGATPQEDEALAAELLASAKDRHEHALVVQAIQERLASLTTTLTVPATPGVMRLSNIQHLFTPIQAELRRPEGVLPLVELLHPTPALGGWPRDAALAFIQEYEQTPRGWYAGPVGWIDHNLDGAFSVAIRSAVVQRRRAWLYAGAGIVAASRPEREWEETGWKFRPVLEALGVWKG